MDKFFDVLILSLGFIIVFAGEMSAQIPRAEHPTPQFERKQWENLNGAWDFTIDYGKTGIERKLYADYSAYDQTITVPFAPESDLSGIAHKGFMPMVWYHRTVTLPDNWNEKRIFLRFGAVDFDSRVWVNGKEVGRHIGGSASFAFEITGALKTGPNDVVVSARDEIRQDVQPSGKQSFRYGSFGVYYTRVTGIWQTVWLEARPQSYIKSVRVVPDVDQDRFVLTPEFDHFHMGQQFKAVLLDQEGKKITEAVTTTEGGTVILPVKNPHLWGPGHPYLYHLKYELVEHGKTLDEVKSYAGLRKIQIAGNTVYLNNKPIFLRLVLDQGFYPDGIWTAPGDQALKADIERSMEVGFNGARLHQKVFEERFHYWADKLGYLTWGEFDDWGSFEFRKLTNSESIRNMKREWAEVVDRDRNHPSIIAWTPLNETAGAARTDIENYRELCKSLYQLTHALDPTRPVNLASGYVHIVTDLYTIHDYDQNPQTFGARYDSVSTLHPEKAWIGYSHQEPELSTPYQGQPYIIDEYGGTFWLPDYVSQPSRGDKRGQWGYGKSEQQVIDRIGELTALLLNNPNIAGFCYTQLTDVEQEVNGIYSYDRHLKFDAEKLRKIFGAPAAIEQKASYAK